uniref:Uncharacterized protein n=1 Tax=Arundo donax TaxID=35708 RepID=A0A0A9A241_ARUDO
MLFLHKLITMHP